MEHVTLSVSGMSCGHCVAAVRKAADAVAGVTVESVELGTVKAAFDPAVTSAAALAQAIEDEGYAVTATA